MYTTNPYKNVPGEKIAKEVDELQKAIYDTPTMLSCLLHLSNSPNPNIAEKARVAYSALLDIKAEAITARAYANQQLIINFEELTK